MNDFNTKSTHAALLLLLVAGTTGCVADPADEDVDVPTVAARPKAWTEYTSEESLWPLQCPAHTVAHGAVCLGGFCDNISLNCVSNAAFSIGTSSWSSWFSEETSPNFRKCGAGKLMTGIDCNGSYCDDISIECSVVNTRNNTEPGNCAWSPYVYSEEDGPYEAPSGKYIAGVGCYGSYCDAMSYWVCSMVQSQ